LEIASRIKSSAAALLGRSGANPPSSPTLVLSFLRLQDLFQGVKNLHAGPQRVAERIEAERHDHEFLHVDRIVGVLTAVDDVHHRRRQEPRARAPQVAKQRQPAMLGGGMRTASETPRMALAPRFFLLSVPSRSIIA
jgi:hypothetical protein